MIGSNLADLVFLFAVMDCDCASYFSMRIRVNFPTLDDSICKLLAQKRMVGIESQIFQFVGNISICIVVEIKRSTNLFNPFLDSELELSNDATVLQSGDAR